MKKRHGHILQGRDPPSRTTTKTDEDISKNNINSLAQNAGRSSVPKSNYEVLDKNQTKIKNNDIQSKNIEHCLTKNNICNF